MAGVHERATSQHSSPRSGILAGLSRFEQSRLEQGVGVSLSRTTAALFLSSVVLACDTRLLAFKAKQETRPGRNQVLTAGRKIGRAARVLRRALSPRTDGLALAVFKACLNRTHSSRWVDEGVGDRCVAAADGTHQPLPATSLAGNITTPPGGVNLLPNPSPSVLSTDLYYRPWQRCEKTNRAANP